MKKIGLLLSCASLAAPAVSLTAQTPSAAPAAVGEQLDLESSQNATVNLVRLLVKQGIISHEDAVGLIRQAENEARIAKSQAESISTAAAQIKAASEAEIQANDSDVRITYVPENVRQDIATDVRNDLVAKAREEKWGATDEPDWVSRIHPFLDFRGRFDNVTLDQANDTTGAFVDFNAINTGKPLDESATASLGSNGYPVVNSNVDRNRTLLRARLGFEADLDDGFTFGLRAATGSGNGPVSTNQTLGSSGNFSKYSLWLDQAFLSWQNSGDGPLGVRVLAGRFYNPFFKTGLTWDDDVQLDGLAVSGAYQVNDHLLVFGTTGLFPIFNTAFSFPSYQTSKYSSDDRYLYALQLGVDTHPTKDIRIKAAVAYYDFAQIEGQISSAFIPLSANDSGDTDGRRPGFAQKGNTYMALRDITPDVSNGFGTTNQWQYYGLASKFTPLTATLQVDYNHFEPFQITFYSEAVKNTAFNVNRFANDPRNSSGNFNPLYFGGSNKAGDFGFLAGLSVGDAVMQKRGDWRVGMDYRYLGSDAFVDAFVDSDFGLGGTNLKGFSLYGRYALSRRVFLGARWMSASQIYNPQWINGVQVDGAFFRSNYLQFDINSKF